MLEQLTAQEALVVESIRKVNFGTVEDFKMADVECDPSGKKKAIDLKPPESKFLRWLRDHPDAVLSAVIVQDGIVQYFMVKSKFPGAKHASLRVKIT